MEMFIYSAYCRIIQLPTTKVVAKDVNDVTKDVTKEILFLIATNSKTTIDELSTKINVDRRTILRKIELLKKENKLEREGGRKDGKWIIK